MSGSNPRAPHRQDFESIVDVVELATQPKEVSDASGRGVPLVGAPNAQPKKRENQPSSTLMELSRARMYLATQFGLFRDSGSSEFFLTRADAGIKPSQDASPTLVGAQQNSEEEVVRHSIDAEAEAEIDGLGFRTFITDANSTPIGIGPSNEKTFGTARSSISNAGQESPNQRLIRNQAVRDSTAQISSRPDATRDGTAKYITPLARTNKSSFREMPAAALTSISVDNDETAKDPLPPDANMQLEPAATRGSTSIFRSAADFQNTRVFGDQSAQATSFKRLDGDSPTTSSVPKNADRQQLPIPSMEQAYLTRPNSNQTFLIDLNLSQYGPLKLKITLKPKGVSMQISTVSSNVLADLRTSEDELRKAVESTGARIQSLLLNLDPTSASGSDVYSNGAGESHANPRHDGSESGTWPTATGGDLESPQRKTNAPPKNGRYVAENEVDADRGANRDISDIYI